MSPSLSQQIRTALAGMGATPPQLQDDRSAVSLQGLAERHWIIAPRAALEGRNLLVLTERPLNAALALASLDGLAGRIVLAPPDLAASHLPSVIADAKIDAVIHDGAAAAAAAAARIGLPDYRIARVGETSARQAAAESLSEWVLFTSGTSGAPKLVVHSLPGLTHAMSGSAAAPDADVRWATFYDVRRYGGLQMLLRALTGGHAMQLVSPAEPVARVIARLAAAKTTHISGTPSHWRSALMHADVAQLTPRYLRLSGEIADQTLLDRIANTFPNARVAHAYASSEAGVGFEVTDGREGFSDELVQRPGPVEIRVDKGILRIRSPRQALRYLGADAPPIADENGFVDTGDVVERVGDRWLFRGRADGMINVGGLKVQPEEVEAVINRRAEVRVSLVSARRNPVLGAVVAAQVVTIDPAMGLGERGEALRAAILADCRARLAKHKAPASIRFVETLPVTAGGKLERRRA